MGKEKYDLAYKTLDRIRKKYNTNEDVEKLKSIFDNYLINMLRKIKDEKIIYKEGTV